MQTEARIFAHLAATFRANIALLEAPDDYLSVGWTLDMKAIAGLIVVIKCGRALTHSVTH